MEILLEFHTSFWLSRSRVQEGGRSIPLTHEVGRRVIGQHPGLVQSVDQREPQDLGHRGKVPKFAGAKHEVLGIPGIERPVGSQNIIECEAFVERFLTA